MKGRRRGSWENGQGVVHSAVESEQAIVDGRLATVGEELLPVQAHGSGTGFDEAVAAKDLGVEVQGVCAIDLMDDELVAAGLDETAGEVGATGIGNEQAATADGEDGLVADGVEGAGPVDGEAVHGEGAEVENAGGAHVGIGSNGAEKAGSEFGSSEGTDTADGGVGGERSTEAGSAGVRDGIHANVDGVGTIARAAPDEAVGHVRHEEISHSSTRSSTEVVTAYEEGATAREVGDVADIQRQGLGGIGIQGQNGTAGHNVDGTARPEVDGLGGRRSGVADDLELPTLHRDVAHQGRADGEVGATEAVVEVGPAVVEREGATFDDGVGGELGAARRAAQDGRALRGDEVADAHGARACGTVNGHGAGADFVQVERGRGLVGGAEAA